MAMLLGKPKEKWEFRVVMKQATFDADEELKKVVSSLVFQTPGDSAEDALARPSEDTKGRTDVYFQLVPPVGGMDQNNVGFKKRGRRYPELKLCFEESEGKFSGWLQRWGKYPISGDLDPIVKTLNYINDPDIKVSQLPKSRTFVHRAGQVAVKKVRLDEGHACLVDYLTVESAETIRGASGAPAGLKPTESDQLQPVAVTESQWVSISVEKKCKDQVKEIVKSSGLWKLLRNRKDVVPGGYPSFVRFLMPKVAPASSMSTRVLLATTSKLKHTAAKRAFELQYGPQVQVTTTHVPSKVPEQPMSHAETLRGANNRLIGAKAKADKMADSERPTFVVAIESGIVGINDDSGAGQYYDFGWIIVEHLATGVVTKTPSAGVRFPTAAVELSKKSDQTQTVGGILAKEGAITNAKDPHTALCNVSRAALLEQAITVAIGATRVAIQQQEAAQETADEPSKASEAGTQGQESIGEGAEKAQ